MLNITTDVPQGLVIGHLLFIIYMNNLSHVSNMFKPIVYTDDSTLTSILSTFDTNSNNNNSDHINSELNKITDWLKLNKLSLNVIKSKCMVFHTAQKHVTNPKLTIDLG